MNNYIHLTLLILAIFILAITTGCGSGDGVTQPGSITTSPDNNNVVENSGSITVKVVWPQPGIEGKCIFSSGGKDEITASMPGDTQKILVTVRSDKDDPNNIFEEYSDQWHLFEWEPGEIEESAFLNPIPAVKVIVRARAYNSLGVIVFSPPKAPIIYNNPISETETELDVILGEANFAELHLGEYALNLSGNSNKFAFIPDFESPDFIAPDTATITAELNIEFPYDDTSGVEPTPMPVKDREIRFQIFSGNAYFDDGTTGKPKTLTVPTGDDGKCQVIVKADETIAPGEAVVVEGKFYALGYDPTANSDCTAYWQIDVIDPLLYEQNFEGYPTGTTIQDIFTEEEDWDWYFGGSEVCYNYVDSNGANSTTQSAYFFSSPETTGYCKFGGQAFFHRNVPYPMTNVELRFYIRTGSEALEHLECYPNEIPKRCGCGFAGYTGIASFGENFIMNDVNDDELGLYNPEEWNYIKIQIVSGPPEKINYWINGVPYEGIIFEKDKMTDNDVRFGVLGTVWLDEIRLYNLNGFARR